MDAQPAQTRSPRVCHIISSFRPLIGGAERVTEDLAAELIRLGADVVVLTRHRRGLPRRARIRDIPVHRLGIDLPKPIGPLAFILHALLWLGVYGRSYPLVHVQNIDSPLLVGMLAKRLLQKTLVATIHIETHMIEMTTTMGRWRVALMAKWGDGFVALTEAIRRQYVDEGIPTERVVDIPNGVDTRLFRPHISGERIANRRRFGLQPGDVIALYMGRLVRRKRVDLVIEAWAALSHADSAHCIIVGDGPERQGLQTLADASGLADRFHLVGATDDVLPYYQMADIFVLPSLYEGLSIALLEAMACGLCVLVAGSPGNLAVVEHGVNGLVFPVDQPQLLHEWLDKALEDAQRRQALGQAARLTVARSHSIQAVAKAHMEMYGNLLSAGTKG
jgi:glycosyltransferase involved in cell wall biosynthesis